MFDIKLFQLNLNNTLSQTYLVYKKLCDEGIAFAPAIYTDKNLSSHLDKNIPVFSSFYMRNSFNKDYILVDYLDYIHIPSYLRYKCIVVCDSTNDVDEILENSFVYLDKTDDLVSIIKERLVNDSIYKND